MSASTRCIRVSIVIRANSDKMFIIKLRKVRIAYEIQVAREVPISCYIHESCAITCLSIYRSLYNRTAFSKSKAGYSIRERCGKTRVSSIYEARRGELRLEMK